jgi:hypothetical protein
MARLRELLAGLSWQRLEPEKDHQVVIGGYGEEAAMALTARTWDKSLSITCIPSTGTESRRLTVNLVEFPGPVFARWYNPTNGGWQTISDAPLPNRGSHDFRTPGDNGTMTNDWVLVLQVR